MSKPHFYMKDGRWVVTFKIGFKSYLKAAGSSPTMAHLNALSMTDKLMKEEEERNKAIAKQMDDEATRGEWMFAAAWVALVAYCVYEFVC